jgi:septum formation inhibitor-activating ATPase MinD
VKPSLPVNRHCSTPLREVSGSVRDSDRIIGILDASTAKAERGETIQKHILITHYDPVRAARSEMISIDERRPRYTSA